ncbi:MAG: LPXTG cell wall anchor domain-containing protein [Ruminococcus sp.]
MRMKKMLAVLAAISMLASMGISAAAEDETAATTETMTSTETEITTTAETTTDSEMETTVATEENETVKEVLEDGTIVYGTKTYQMGENGDGTPDFHDVKVVLYDTGDVIERLSVYVDGTLSNLAGIAVDSAIAGDEAAHDYRDNPDNFFAITGVNEVAITAYGVTTNYNYYSGQFVKVGETITTTTPTTSTTTTTTTVTSGEIVVDGTELSRYAFSLNGINFTAVLFEEKWNGVSADLNYLLTIYKGSSATNLDSIIANYKYDIGTESSSTDVKDYISVLNDTVTVSIHNGTTTSYIYDTAKNAFVEADSEQEKTFTVEIPTSYVTAVCGITGEPITESNYKNSMVVSVTDITGCTNGTASIVSNGSFVAGFTVKDAKPGTITITGTTGTFSSNDDPSINTSHGQCGAAGNPDTFTVTVTIDENGNITGTSPVTPDAPVQPTVLEIYENDSLTVTGTLSYEWDEAYMSFKHAILTLDTPITIKYMDGEWIDKAGTTQTIDSVQIALDDEFPEGTRLKVTGNVMYGHTIHHLRDIVLLDCTYEVLDSDGKTDSGSTTSNKPSNNNTAGTPKTGDVATLPAVALGLTMTAAGVVAVLYKKRK